MNSTQLPDFEHTLALTQGNLEATDLAECHGIGCGLLCRLPDASLDAFIGLLDMLEVVKTPGSGLRMALEELLNATREQLLDEIIRCARQLNKKWAISGFPKGQNP